MKQKIKLYRIALLLLSIVSLAVLFFTIRSDFCVSHAVIFAVCTTLAVIISPRALLLFKKKYRLFLLVCSILFAFETVILFSILKDYKESQMLTVTIYVLAILAVCGIVFLVYKYIKAENKRKLFMKSFIIMTVAIYIFSFLFSITVCLFDYFDNNAFTQKNIFTPSLVSNVEATNEAKTKEDSYIKSQVNTLAPIIDGTYDSLSIQEKLDTWQTICNIETTFHGISTPISVEMMSIEKKGDFETYAFYADDFNTIYLNQAVFEKLPVYDALCTVLHECYHSYQYEQIEILNSLPKEYRNSTLFNEVKVYEINLENYSDPENSFEQYQNQYIELRADEYAAKASKEYLELIDGYLNGEKFK